VDVAVNLLPALVDGGIPIFGGLLSTLYGYGVLRTKNQSTKLTRSLKWLGPAVSLFGVWLLVSDLRTPAAASEKDLAAVEAEINRRAPMMVDDVTRLDGVKAANGELAYYLTITNRGADEPSWAEFQQTMSERLRSYACSRADYKRFLSEGIGLRMVYRSKEQAEVATVVIPPSHCGYKDHK
jgi:hypothetical protein